MFLFWIAWPLTYGTVIGTTVVAVVQSSLGPFAQALIIALVAAIVGAFGQIIAALLARQSAERVLHETRQVSDKVDDVKKKVGAVKRNGDPAPGG